MNAAPFNLLFVSDDRSLLRHLSRFLEAFGYDVRQAAGTAQAISALESRRVDFMILDEKTQGGFELQQLLHSQDRPIPYTMLLTENPTAASLAESLSRGIDDFLTKPVVHGEVLARLRAGARVLEHDRRISQNWGTDLATGLPNRETFLRRLSRQLYDHSADGRQPSCVVLSVDFIERISKAHGPNEVERVLKLVTDILAELVHESQSLASLGNGRIGVVLPETSADEAVAWANRVQSRLAETEMRCLEQPVRLTASIGVAQGAGEATSCDELLQHAMEALVQAKRSGGDCVVKHGEFEEEKKAWKELAAPGRLFEQTAARHIMIPCTVTLKENDSADLAKRLMQQTKWNVIPVVDPTGKLVGAVHRDANGEMCEAQTETVDASPNICEMMQTDVMQCDEETTFAEIMDFFAKSESDVVYVTNNDRPSGIVHRGNLASLSQPLRSDTFTPDSLTAGRGTEMLRVAE